MNVLYINSAFYGGGAERIARMVFSYYSRVSDGEAYFIGGHNGCNRLDKQEHVYVIYSSYLLRAFNRILTWNHGHSNNCIPYTRFYLWQFLKRNHVDIVHLHNAHGNYIGIHDIAWIAERYPVVWTVHDFWPCTAHCSVPPACTKLYENCVECPHLEAYPPLRRNKTPAKLYREKIKSFTKKGIFFVAPSGFVKNELQKTFLTEEKIEVIYNAVKSTSLVAHEKISVRKARMIPAGKNVLAVISAQLSIKRKGMGLLLEALDRLPDIGNYHLIVAGGKFEFSGRLVELGIGYTDFGYLYSQEQLSEFYSCADVLVNPSLNETFGLITIEAMSCGTPVIAYDVCANSEIIKDDVGWLTKDVTSQSLSDAIEIAFTNRSILKQKQDNSRKYAINNFSEERMMDGYMNLYEECIREFGRRH